MALGTESCGYKSGCVAIKVGAVRAAIEVGAERAAIKVGWTCSYKSRAERVAIKVGRLIWAQLRAGDKSVGFGFSSGVFGLPCTLCLSADTCEHSRACSPPLGSSGSRGRPGSHSRIALGTCEFGMRYGGVLRGV